MPRKTARSWTPAGSADHSCPSAGPRAPRRYLNPVKSACVFGQPAGLGETKERADDDAVRRPSGCRERHSPFFFLFWGRSGTLERKCDFTTNRCGLVTPPGAATGRRAPLGPRGVCVHHMALLENDWSGHTVHRVSLAPTTHSLVLRGINLLSPYQCLFFSF